MRLVKNTYVYFIQSGNKHIKIGHTNNLQHRLENMQVGNPHQLYLRASFGPMSKKMAEAVEKDLHAYFRSFHVRGEWFTKKILTKLKRHYWSYLFVVDGAKVQAHDV